MPTLVLEAMALRRPVVVPDVDGCVEAVGDHRNGFIYRHGDLDDLAEKTMAALVDQKCGQRARERVLAEYDWRVIVPKLDAIYSRLLER
jgi:glycosyltransferase involved in cell wall biosynthesis